MAGGTRSKYANQSNVTRVSMYMNSILNQLYTAGQRVANIDHKQWWWRMTWLYVEPSTSIAPVNSNLYACSETYALLHSRCMSMCTQAGEGCRHTKCTQRNMIHSTQSIFRVNAVQKQYMGLWRTNLILRNIMYTSHFILWVNAVQKQYTVYVRCKVYIVKYDI